MQDEMRADLLYRALASGEPLSADLDDVELAALFDLGTELQLHGATIAMIEEADTRFNPVFSRELRGTLMAQHAASAVPESALTPAAPERAIAAISRRSRRLWRRLVVGGSLLLALLVVVTIALTQSTRQPSLVGVARLTATAPHSLTNTAMATAASGGVTAARPGAKNAATPSADAHIRLASGTDLAPVTATSKPKARVFAQNHTPPLPATTNRYDLPATFPILPKSALVYRVRFAPITDAAFKRIFALFPDAQPSGTIGTLSSSPGQGASLSINRRDGEITYIAPTGASVVPTDQRLSTAAAKAVATAWLSKHGFVSAAFDLKHPAISTAGGVTTVRFAPSLAFPLSDSQTVTDLTLRLSIDGRVTYAHQLAPTFAISGSVHLLTPVGAAQPANTSPPPAAGGVNAMSKSATTNIVHVDTVSLVYVPVKNGATISLRPFYRFRGHSLGTRAPQHDSIYLVPASTAHTP